MSRLAYYTDFLAIPAFIVGLIGWGGAGGAGILMGLLAWTLAEYVIHRWLFHRLPWFKPGHDLHHDKPWARTGVTSWHSAAIFALLWLVLPAGIVAGLAIGYLGYIGFHHLVHHWRIDRGHPLYGLKLRHTMHHKGLEGNFGVITTFWDRVFGTYVAPPAGRRS